MIIDPVELTKNLINCNTENPKGKEAIFLIKEILEKNSFDCKTIERNGILNLFARSTNKNKYPTFGYNGHVDVVSAGSKELWRFDPFIATEENGFIYGRGACDMKSSVASFVSASINVIEKTDIKGSIVITLTSDEEGIAKDGTLAILDWIKNNNEKIDHCLVGEPTSKYNIGDTIKIGRRGSLNVKITAEGIQGHVAYPQKAKNPVEALCYLASELKKCKIDNGNNFFDPSSLNITNFDTNNKTKNVIPSSCTLDLNIRFNNLQTKESLIKFINSKIKPIEEKNNINFILETNLSGEPFINDSKFFTNLVVNSIETLTKIKPNLSTSGGTSDARFIKDHCPVLEFGLNGNSMHETNERVEIKQIYTLTNIYVKILSEYFKSFK